MIAFIFTVLILIATIGGLFTFFEICILRLFLKIENFNFLKKHLQNLAKYKPEFKTKIEKILKILLQEKLENLTNRKSKKYLGTYIVNNICVDFNTQKWYYIKKK